MTDDRPHSSPDTGPTTTTTRGGHIAARIDRLPLTRVQYLLAAITQVYWGMLIDTDGLVGRLYPFVWEPQGMSTFQFSVLLAGNIGAGILSGQYLGGFLSDRFGRKKILVASAVADAIFLWPIAHTSDFWWLLLWNYLYGAGLGLMLSTNNVYLHEIAPPNMRHRLAMRTQLITAVCAIVPGVLGLMFVPENWRWFIYVLVIIQLVVVTPLGLFFLPESPRWLESKGRTEEADRIVSRWEARIERSHGPLPEPDLSRNPVVQTKKVPLRELFRGQYGKRILLIMIVWSLAYAGIVYGASSYLPTYLVDNHWSSDEVFLWVSIIAALTRVGGFYIASFTGERVERKKFLMTVGIAWAALFCLLLVFHGKPAQIIIILVALPLGTLWLFNMYNYTSQAFPTRFRSAGYSWSNGIGHTAAVWGPMLIAPLFALTAHQGHWGWILWVALPGAVLPSLLIGKFGIKQRGQTLEETAT
ncbi:MAG TPA: MFS transporter [Streptosporangiaceae bacterium]